ncbi:MAG: NUDIX hydrolase [Proteobacteria bacterium]|nr:NUDIX hydrolase [Pseudomonadota bacterium]
MNDILHSPWQVLKTSEIFSAEPWLALSVQQVRVPDGRIIDDFYQLALPDFTLVFAATPSGEIIMIRQYKHGAKRTSLTLPGGLVEKGEDPEEAAKRELLEETGYQAESWQSLGSYVVNGNLGCGKGHFFMAAGAKPVQEPESGDLETMEIELLSREQIAEALRSGEVMLLNHAAVIALAMMAEGASEEVQPTA